MALCGSGTTVPHLHDLLALHGRLHVGQAALVLQLAALLLQLPRALRLILNAAQGLAALIHITPLHLLHAVHLQGQHAVRSAKKPGGLPSVCVTHSCTGDEQADCPRSLPPGCCCLATRPSSKLQASLRQGTQIVARAADPPHLVVQLQLAFQAAPSVFRVPLCLDLRQLLVLLPLFAQHLRGGNRQALSAHMSLHHAMPVRGHWGTAMAGGVMSNTSCKNVRQGTCWGCMKACQLRLPHMPQPAGRQANRQDGTPQPLARPPCVELLRTQPAAAPRSAAPPPASPPPRPAAAARAGAAAPLLSSGGPRTPLGVSEGRETTKQTNHDTITV